VPRRCQRLDSGKLSGAIFGPRSNEQEPKGVRRAGNLVGEYPATEIEMRFRWFGRPHVQRHPIYLEWRPESEDGPFLDAEYVAREAVTVSLHI
jgi:hypothetical protein